MVPDFRGFKSPGHCESWMGPICGHEKSERTIILLGVKRGLVTTFSFLQFEEGNISLYQASDKALRTEKRSSLPPIV